MKFSNDPGDCPVTGRLLRIQRYCINDGPGIRTTVFLQGCALRCKWCHNPESIVKRTVLMFNESLCALCGLCAVQCGNGVHTFVDGVHKVDFNACEACGDCLKSCMPEALSLHGRNAGVAEVMGEILRDRDYYLTSGGGVTISGGEPLQQPEFTVALSKACRAEGLTVYLDTCGFAPKAVFDEVAASVDGFLYDIKMLDPQQHRYWTGQDNRWILDNFSRAVSGGKPVRMRVILIPGLTDTPENLVGLVKLARRCHFSGPIDLMPYHRMGAGKYRNMGMTYPMEGVEPPTPEQLRRAAGYLETAGFTTKVQ